MKRYINTYKKFILILVIVQIICSFSIFAMAKNQSVIGYIQVYGNEPHTYLGIKTEDGKIFTLKADNDVLSELQSQQGVLVKLDGKVIEKTSSFMGKFQFEVRNWNVVSNLE